MPELSSDTRQEILDLLEPRMVKEEDRHAVLNSAFGSSSSITMDVDFRGSAHTFTVNLVNKLISFGEIEEGKQALWAFLEVIRRGVGVDNQKRIDTLYPKIELLSQKKPPLEVSSPPETPKRPTKPLRKKPIVKVEDSEPVIEKPKKLPKEKTEQKLFDKAETSPKGYFNRMVPIPKDNPRFYVAAFLVSNGLYHRFINSNQSWHPNEGEEAQKFADENYLQHWRNGQPRDDELDLPVTYISVNAAKAFAKWFSDLLETDVQLPTLQEWDTAVRAGRSDWLAEEIQAGRVNFYHTSNKLQNVVGAYEPNPYGIIDLLGNAYDICMATDGSTITYLLAGGCFHNTEADLRAKLDAPQKIESLTACIKNASFRCVYST